MINVLPGLAMAAIHPLFYLALQFAIEFNQPSTTATYGARITTLVLLCVLSLYSLKDGQLKAKWSYLHASLIIFMILYLSRIYVLNYEQTWNLRQDLYPYSKVFPLFLFGVIAPCILCLLSSTLFSRPWTSRIFIFSTFASVVGLAAMNVDQFGTFRTEGVEAGSIAALSMGYMAALGIGYCLLDFLRLHQYPKLVLILVLACCVFLISISASRGPLIATLVSVLYIFLTMKKSFINVLSGIILVAATVVLGYLYLEYSGSGLFQRIEGVAERAEEGEYIDSRVFLYEQSIEIIKDNWLTGKDIALPNSFWPHNYVLEATMAVGVFAILLVIPWIAALIKIFTDSASDNNQWLYVWLLQTSTMNMFTEAIWSGSGLFICLFLVLGLGKAAPRVARRRRRRRRRKSSSQRRSSNSTRGRKIGTTSSAM